MVNVVTTTEFIGRTKETADVVDLLPEIPLVTLVGTAGIGKTRLATQIARDLHDDFPGGVMHIDLTTTTADLLDSDLLAARLGHRSFELAVDALSQTTALIVLDNCEHVLDELAAPVDALLRECRDIRVLATSRAPLELPAEHVYPLRPLPIDDAVELLRTRATSAGAELPTAPDANGQLTAVATRVDCLPLALELAAIRLRSLDADQVIGSLDANLDLLRRGAGRRSGGDRHDSIVNAIAWSYELLDSDHRAAIRRLSVLENGFRLERAHSVIGAADVGRSAEVLDGLVARSLVATTLEDRRIRYRLLQTIRQYANDRLREAGEFDEAVERFVESVRAIADDLVRHAVERWDDGVVAAARDIAPELLAALRICLERDETGDRACALMLPGWGLVHETSAGEIARVGAEIMTRWAPTTPGWGDVAAITATASMRLSQLDRSLEQAGRAIEVGGLLAVPVGHRAVAMVQQHQGRFDDALIEVRAAREAARQLGLSPFEAELHLFETSLLGQIGDLPAAIEHAERARRANASSAPVSKWAQVLEAFLLLDVDAARALHLARSMATIPMDDRDTGQPATSTAMIARHLGSIHLWHDDTAQAAVWLRAALQASREVGERPHTWATLQCTGLAAVRCGDLTGDDGLSYAGRRLVAACSVSVDSPAPGFIERRLAENVLGSRTVAPSTDTDVVDVGGIPYEFGFSLLDRIESVHALHIDADESTSDEATAAGREDGRIEIGPDTCDLAWRDERARLAATKGMADLAVLIGRQGVEISAAELMGGFVDEADVGATIDAEAKRAYDERLVALQADIVEADNNNDLARLELLQEEFDRIVEHLSSALGLGGRPRRPGGSTEKARSAVTWRVRAAIRKIDVVMPGLGRHLRASVRTGAFCVYDPEQPTRWEIVSDM